MMAGARECHGRIDQANTNVKLQTLEALQIWKKRRRIKTRDGFRSRELALLLAKYKNDMF